MTRNKDTAFTPVEHVARSIRSSGQRPKRSSTHRAAAIPKSKTTALVPIEHIAHSILILRGQRVLLDNELALLYDVTTKRFNEQVKRNLARFPVDFMFRLNANEAAALRSQFATLKTGRGRHRKYLPYAFTEHGAIMAATILNSPRAVEMSVHVVRAFVQLRDLLASNRQLAEKFAELERAVSSHDQAIVGILKAIREFMHPPEPKKRPIGFFELEEKKR